MTKKQKQLSSLLDHILQKPDSRHQSRKNQTINILGDIYGEHFISNGMSAPIFDRLTNLAFLEPMTSGERCYNSPEIRKHIIDAVTGRVI